jgi:hypothetical protein
VDIIAKDEAGECCAMHVRFANRAVGRGWQATMVPSRIRCSVRRQKLTGSFNNVPSSWNNEMWVQRYGTLTLGHAKGSWLLWGIRLVRKNL